MVIRDDPSVDPQTLTYDAENRLVQVQQGGLTIAAYTFDGDGNLVKAVEDGKVTHYAGAHYEACLSGCPESTGTVERSYYYAGSARIAMRVTYDAVNEVYYILTDHLGSTSKVVYFDQSGDLQVKAQQWYKPLRCTQGRLWGEVRQVSGEVPTDRTFHGCPKPDPAATTFSEGQ